MVHRLSPFLAAMLVLGLVFLYGPIVSVIVYSFNASRLATVWAGFSTHWYGELWRNEQIRAAARVSIEVAVASATGALPPLSRPDRIRDARDGAPGHARDHHRAVAPA